ncbi:MAG: YggT family protein [Dehalococcoidia bacterium]
MLGFGSISSIGDLIALLLQLLWLAILIRAIMSWVSPDPHNPIVQALNAITDPVLQPLRQIMPRTGMIDFTPLVALILLQVLIALVRASDI